MKYWLMKKFGIIRRRNVAELEIINELEQMNLSENDIDDIVDIVKNALDRQFK